MEVLRITSENYEKEVERSEVPVLLDFWASWCGPCRMMSPVVDEIAEGGDASFKVGKVNVDEEPELAERFEIRSVPTIVVVNQGSEFRRSVGAKPKSAVLSMLP